MRTIVIFILSALFTADAYCQKAEFEKPDYKGIKKIINNEKSNFYYPELFKRYINSDTTLSLQDFRILYYGYLFNKSYKAYAISNLTDSLNIILKKDSLRSDDFNLIIRYEKLILEESPYNLRDLNLLSYAYLQIGDTLSSILTYFKLNMLIGTILSTGDGIKESTAWHVISVSHEYDILSALGFRFGGSQSLTKKGCDFLKVADNDHGIEGFYFDVNMILDKESEIFK